ncbi:MAG: Hint domain-containing protein [Paracoccaceae bacterium]|nr:Hint domain-containing protein [Paracoccaceae bacterium]
MCHNSGTVLPCLVRIFLRIGCYRFHNRPAAGGRCVLESRFMSKEKITIPLKTGSAEGAGHHADPTDTIDSTQTYETHEEGIPEDTQAHVSGMTHSDEIGGGSGDAPAAQAGQGSAGDRASDLDAFSHGEADSADADNDDQHSGEPWSDDRRARVETQGSHHAENDEGSGSAEHHSDSGHGDDGQHGHDDDHGHDDHDHGHDDEHDHDDEHGHDDDSDDHIVCFAAGTLIDTPSGPVRVEDLGVGKMVLCGDGVARKILWFSGRQVTPEEMREHPEFRPIRIRKGAFGDNLPYRDLLVSPQHRILINDWRASLMFGVEKVLVPAVHLLNDRDIVRDHGTDGVVYYHFMFDRHHTVISNGIQSESFFPGGTALAGVDEAAKRELLRLFPQLSEGSASYGQTCCPTLKAYEAMALLGG